MSQTITIDFNHKLISESAMIWVAFPGSGYRLQKDFYGSNTVYPDILELPDDDKIFEDTKKLTPVISRSDALREFHRAGSTATAAPSMDLKSYEGARTSKKRANAKGVVNGYFSRAQKGDLVLVPLSGGFLGQVAIGELLDKPSVRLVRKSGLYPQVNVLARRVHWLKTLDYENFSPEIVTRLTTPNGFIQLRKSLHRQIYLSAYKNFSQGDQFASLISTQADVYSSVSSMHLSMIYNLAAAIAERIETSSPLEDLLQRDYFDICFDQSENLYSSELAIRIQSPGNIGQYAKTITPILANVLLRIATLGADTLKSIPLEFENSENGGRLDPSDLKVKQGAEAACKIMDLASLKKMCVSGNTAIENAELSVPIKLINGDGSD